MCVTVLVYLHVFNTNSFKATVSERFGKGIVPLIRINDYCTGEIALQWHRVKDAEGNSIVVPRRRVKRAQNQ